MFLISLKPSATREGIALTERVKLHSLECCHLQASPGRLDEVLQLRCQYKQCLCGSIQGFCSRIKASTFDV